LENQSTEKVHTFKYLGCTVSNNFNYDINKNSNFSEEMLHNPKINKREKKEMCSKLLQSYGRAGSIEWM
jgi:hypothetical protein